MRLKHLPLIAMVAMATAVSAAHACTVTDIGGTPFKGSGNPDGNNNPDSNFNALTLFLAANPGSSVGTPIPGATEESNINGPVDVSGFSYAVVHYGSGRGGNPGGSLEFFSITESGSGSCEFTFPQNGVGNGGFGGISSIRLFTGEHENVPDSGATAMLLGSALTGLGIARRYLKR